jgi:hypothetical protein
MLEAIRNLFNLSSPRSNAATLRRLTRHAHQDRESLSALLGTVQSIVSRLDVLEAHRGGAADAAQEALAALREITTDADEKVAQLHRLAEHVLQKMRALEGQKAAVDRAVQEAARVNDMVWTMEGQIGKLEAALRDAVRGEETAVRIQKMVEDIDGRIDVALKLRTEFMRDASRFEREGTALTTSIRHSLGSPSHQSSAAGDCNSNVSARGSPRLLPTASKYGHGPSRTLDSDDHDPVVRREEPRCTNTICPASRSTIPVSRSTR